MYLDTRLKGPAPDPQPVGRGLCLILHHVVCTVRSCTRRHPLFVHTLLWLLCSQPLLPSAGVRHRPLQRDATHGSTGQRRY